MKTIGLIGGMSWESTASYYKSINELTKRRLGGLHSAKIILVSVDFHEIEILQREGRWKDSALVLIEAAKSLEKAGADLFILCTNTMHKVADEIETSVSIPFIHIADATGESLRAKNMSKVGLLGTRFTMEEGFYKSRLAEKFCLDIQVPSAKEREKIHSIIYDELCLGKTNSESRNYFIEVIKNLRNKGAEAIILGCTEIAILIQQEHVETALFDTTEIHAEKVVAIANSD